MKNITKICNFKNNGISKLLFLVLFFTIGTQFTNAQTTRYWVGGASGNIDAAANWSLSSGGTALAPGTITFPNLDVFVFDSNSTSSVTLFFTGLNNAKNRIGKLQISGNRNVIVSANANGAKVLRIRENANDALLVAAGSSLTINGYYLAGNDFNMTVSMDAVTGIAEASISGIVKVTADPGGTSKGIFTKSADGLINFNSGSVYHHALNGGALPTSTWNLNSTCLITGITNTNPTSLNQTFGNREWNCSSQNSDLSITGSFFAPISGTNLNLVSTGSNQLFFTANINALGNLNVTGGKYIFNANTANRNTSYNNLTISAGTISVSDFPSATGNHNFNVNGDLQMNGGTIDIYNSSSNYGRLNVDKNVTLAAGTLTCTTTPSSTNTGFYFSGNTEQIFTNAGGVITGAVNFRILANAIVNFGTAIIDGTSGEFILSANGKIITSNSAGLTSTGAMGTVQNTGARTYSSGASYEFRGSNTGNFTLSNPNVISGNGVLTFNNASGVTIDQNFTTVALALPNGVVNTNGNFISISNNGTYTGGSTTAYVNGQLKRVFSAPIALTFPIGKGGNYRPVTFNYTALTGNSTITIEQIEVPLTGALPVGVTLNSSRVWAVSKVGGSAFNYQITLDATGDVPTGTVVMLKKQSGVTTSTATTPTAPDFYTNTTGFTSLTNVNEFALGSNAAVTVWNGTAWSLGAPTLSTAAIIAGNYTSAADGTLNAALLTVNSGNVVISSADNITLSGALVVNAPGTFTLQNNANLIQTTNAFNTGTIVVNRNSNPLSRLDYTFWSSPVVTQNLLAFSPATLTNRFYTYDPSTNQYLQVSSPSTTDFSVGNGYLIRMPNDAPTAPTTVVFPGVFAGTPNNGNVSLAVTTGTFYGIGNPYPSTIDADTFITDNGLTGALYFWRKINGAAGLSYATYTLAGGVSSPSSAVPNGIIQVGQGFLTEPSSTSITFTNSMRVANNADQFFKTTTEEKSRIWLDLTNNNGYEGQMMIAYMNGATLGVDSGVDGKYFNDNQTALTTIIDGQEFVIQGRPLPFETTDVVPLGFKSNLVANFTIALNQVDGVFSNGQAIYLKDKLTNVTQNLTEGSYTFSSETGVFNNRFELLYEGLLSVNSPSAILDSNVVIFKQGQYQVVNAGRNIIKSLQVYDLTGRLVLDKKDINAFETRIEMNIVNQVYFVKINTEQGLLTKKIIN